ncbi:hypothetical protein AC629_26530 [Bradyrhizobium sp. NAS80.1]|nr:hypothetical protein AC629_26530 [Bradyrhizobium sp. NAS80.1]
MTQWPLGQQPGTVRKRWRKCGNFDRFWGRDGALRAAPRSLSDAPPHWAERGGQIGFHRGKVERARVRGRGWLRGHDRELKLRRRRSDLVAPMN